MVSVVRPAILAVMLKRAPAEGVLTFCPRFVFSKKQATEHVTGVDKDVAVGEPHVVVILVRVGDAHDANRTPQQRAGNERGSCRCRCSCAARARRGGTGRQRPAGEDALAVVVVEVGDAHRVLCEGVRARVALHVRILGLGFADRRLGEFQPGGLVLLDLVRAIGLGLALEGQSSLHGRSHRRVDQQFGFLGLAGTSSLGRIALQGPFHRRSHISPGHSPFHNCFHFCDSSD